MDTAEPIEGASVTIADKCFGRHAAAPRVDWRDGEGEPQTVNCGATAWRLPVAWINRGTWRSAHVSAEEILLYDRGDQTYQTGPDCLRHV